MNNRRRWLALYVLCLADLMTVLDTNIVNVALPTIQEDLGFSQAALAWVVNAYMLTFGGFLLLSGRLADLYGARRVFLVGVGVFTAASMACGLATTPAALVAARALQGLGGAAVSAVALALIIRLFTDPAGRAKAMGVFGFVLSGGVAFGVLLGGLLTGLLTWNWIFWVNVPVGVSVLIASGRVVPADPPTKERTPLDVSGAALITSALMLAVYGIIGGNDAGWTSAQTIGLLTLSAALGVGFVVREAITAHPLVPLRLFRLRNLSVSQIVGALWGGAMFASFFLSALHLQQVLGYSALEVGLAFLPISLVMAICSLQLSDRLVLRLGLRTPVVVGLLLVAVGLALLARAPVEGSYAIDILPSLLLLGAGNGIATNPLLLAAMGAVTKQEAGVASGVTNTSIMMGGAFGLAVLVAVSTWRTGPAALGAPAVEELNAGLQLGFGVGAAFALLAAGTGGFLLRMPPVRPEGGHPAAPQDEPAGRNHPPEGRSARQAHQNHPDHR